MKIGTAPSALGVRLDTMRRLGRAGRITFERLDNRRYISRATSRTSLQSTKR
jgi:hypothetical protein